jgi:hypothetical protein
VHGLLFFETIFFKHLNLIFMAHANNNIITGNLKGSVGKQLVFRQWEGKTIVSKFPKSRTGNPTPAQAEITEKFQLASRYAKSVLSNANQSLAQAYATALKPRQNVYSRALEDFLSAPVVKNIDTRNYSGAEGEKIVIRALDDYRVTTVRVEIRDAEDRIIDTGNAVQDLNGIDWTYAATYGNAVLPGTKIRAIATDVPGNEGMLEVTL